MNILIQLGHPAHFHLYKNIIHRLQENDHNIYVLIKKKDVLEDLLINAKIPYINIFPNIRKNTKWAIIKATLTRLFRIAIFTVKHKITLLTGSSTEIAQVARLFKRHSIILGEDDATIIPQFVSLASVFMDSYLTPISCNMGKIEKRVIKYEGFHKLTYLHPNQFTPDLSIVKQYIDTDKPYFIIRFAQLKAYHDTNIDGITSEIAQKLINILEPAGNIYITSERELEPQFEKYRLNINPLDIHHILAYAGLYIGDSQSMAVEAAMLGVPSVRFNDFAGRIGVLEELEHKYGLTYGIKTSQPDLLFAKIEELIDTPNLRDEFQRRRQKMLADKIDVTAFLVWFIENYPQSAEIMKKNPDYQFRFR